DEGELPGRRGSVREREIVARTCGHRARAATCVGSRVAYGNPGSRRAPVDATRPRRRGVSSRRRPMRRAIERPGEQAGLVLEPGVAEAILRDVTGQPGGLPLLSHSL